VGPASPVKGNGSAAPQPPHGWNRHCQAGGPLRPAPISPRVACGALHASRNEASSGHVMRGGAWHCCAGTRHLVFFTFI
jgi:hypothetical protein